MDAPEDRRAVRVELDDLSSGAAPEVVANPAGSPNWAIGLVVAVIAAVVVALVALAPDSSAVAEEALSERAADGLDGSINQGEVVSGDFGRPLVLDGVLTHVFTDEDGFVGVLGNVAAATTPTIVRSADGVEWSEIQTSVDVFEGSVESAFDSSSFPLAPQLWSGVMSVGSEFVLEASDALYVSDDAVTWTLVASTEQSASNEVPIEPVVVGDDSLLGLQLGPSQAFATLFDEHTSVEAPADGICDAARFGPSSDLTFRLTSCAGDDLGVLTPRSVDGPLVAGVVLECVQLLVSSQFNIIPRIVRQDLGPDGDVLVLGDDTLARIRPSAGVTGLRNGGFVGVDFGPNGVPPSDTCRDVIDIDTASRPAFVVVDPTSDQVTRWASPDGVSFLDELPIVFGEVTLPSGRSLLVVDFDGQLWTLDIATGEWVDLQEPVDTPFTRVFDETIAISRSGERIYRLSSDELTAFDVFEDEDGGVRATATTEPVDIGRYISRLEVVFAGDEILTFIDGGSSWTIDVPPLVAN